MSPSPIPERRLMVYTWIGIGLSVFLLAMLVVAESALQTVRPGSRLMAGITDNIVVSGLVGLAVCSLLVQLYVRVRRDQREVVEQFRHALEHRRPPVLAHAYVGRSAVQARDADTEPIAKSQEAPELDPGVVDISSRIAGKLNNHR